MKIPVIPAKAGIHIFLVTHVSGFPFTRLRAEALLGVSTGMTFIGPKKEIGNPFEKIWNSPPDHFDFLS
jgi:hypothetical protein